MISLLNIRDSIIISVNELSLILVLPFLVWTETKHMAIYSVGSSYEAQAQRTLGNMFTTVLAIITTN